MFRRTFPLAVLLATALAVPVLVAQTTAPSQAGAQSGKAEWPPAGVIRMNRGVQSPEVIKESKPQYTTAAREAGIQGIVALEAIVKADGTVGEVRVVHSLDKQYGLDEAAIAALKEWRFKPGRTKDGTAVPVLIDVELTFSLRKS